MSTVLSMGEESVATLSRFIRNFVIRITLRQELNNSITAKV